MKIKTFIVHTAFIRGFYHKDLHKQSNFWFYKVLL